MATQVGNTTVYAPGEMTTTGNRTSSVDTANRGTGQVPSSTPSTSVTMPSATATPISVDNLGKTTSTPISLPEAKPYISPSVAVSAPQGSVAGQNGLVTNPPPTETTPTADKKTFLDMFSKIFNAEGQKSAVQEQLNQQENVTNLQNQKNADYNAYLQAKNDQTNTINQMRAQAGGTVGGNNQAIAEYQRQSDAHISNLAIQSNISQGNYQAAEDNVNKKLDAIFSPLKDQANLLTAMASIANNDMTDSEKFQAQKLADQVKTDQTNVQKAAADIQTSLLGTNNYQKVAPQIDQISQDFAAGKITAAEAQSKMYAAASQYGGNTLDTQYKQLQIQKLQQDISSAGGTDTMSAIPSMVQYTIASGNLPPMGMGNQNMRMEFWNQLGKALGGDQSGFGELVSTKAQVTGATSALRNQATLYAATKTSVDTLTQQLELAKSYSDKVDRTGSPLINKYLLYAKGQIAGDADTAAFQNIVKTASNEFAKIMSGASASISGVTVSSSADAEKILNTAQTPAQLKEIMSAMEKEANYRLSSYQGTMANITNDLKSMGGNQSSNQTVKSNGQTYSVGQVYQDASGAKWTVDSSGKWSKQ